MLIAGMDPNGPAAQSGLKVNDLIVGINNQPISSFRNALDLVADTRPGTKLPFRVIRNGEPLDVSVTIGEDPS